MRLPSCILALALFCMAGRDSGQEEKPPKPGGQTTVFSEKVKGATGSWTGLTGKVKVLNAYTLLFDDGTQVDFRFAVNIPEPEQMGLIGEKLYTCGKEAAEYLANVIGEKPVAFYTDGTIVPGKTPRGKCFVGETDLQQEMVRNGWAVSGHSGMDAWEIIARENKRGLWRGQFIHPKNWRNGERLPGEK